jgi:hypothetical protein
MGCAPRVRHPGQCRQALGDCARKRHGTPGELVDNPGHGCRTTMRLSTELSNGPKLLSSSRKVQPVCATGFEAVQVRASIGKKRLVHKNRRALLLLLFIYRNIREEQGTTFSGSWSQRGRPIRRHEASATRGGGGFFRNQAGDGLAECMHQRLQGPRFLEKGGPAPTHAWRAAGLPGRCNPPAPAAWTIGVVLGPGRPVTRLSAAPHGAACCPWSGTRCAWRGGRPTSQGQGNGPWPPDLAARLVTKGRSMDGRRRFFRHGRPPVHKCGGTSGTTGHLSTAERPCRFLSPLA